MLSTLGLTEALWWCHENSHVHTQIHSLALNSWLQTWSQKTTTGTGSVESAFSRCLCCVEAGSHVKVNDIGQVSGMLGNVVTRKAMWNKAELCWTHGVVTWLGHMKVQNSHVGWDTVHVSGEGGKEKKLIGGAWGLPWLPFNMSWIFSGGKVAGMVLVILARRGELGGKKSSWCRDPRANGGVVRRMSCLHSLQTQVNPKSGNM